jgi:hypothetical protein
VKDAHRAALAGLLVAVLGLLAGCSGAGGTGSSAFADTPRAEPAEQRPVVSLAFEVAPDLRSAAGREDVVVTPDLPTCELVFRATPNKPTAARTGSSLEVTSARVDGTPVAPRTEAGGAPTGTPGALVVLPLPRCVEGGTPVRAELAFSLRLGLDADERLGVSPSTGTAWFGSGFPLLTWVRGEGWTREPEVAIYGESTTSEDFRLAALDVTAPADLAVAGTGVVAGASPGPTPGTTTHRFTAEAVRDVAVAVGRYRVLERSVAGGVRLHLFTPVSGTRVAPEVWADELDRALSDTIRLLGPYPYEDLWVAIAPGQSDGTEFPSALQFGDVSRATLRPLAVHELAHQWFYAQVGNNQARDPWIDEAFATWTESTVTGSDGDDSLAAVPDTVAGRLGWSMSRWSGVGFDRYVTGVYTQGAAALSEARRRAGPERFDAAVRAYLAANAHRVVRPDDVSRAFAEVPEAQDTLRRAGALPPGPAAPR